ncbi:hypothetical protein K2Z84_04200 [Candidatus Binatia bacterium]|jgi:hypothetical protein|nr:hypothetical protein [Candidatus Binatia bacterium]
MMRSARSSGAPRGIVLAGIATFGLLAIAAHAGAQPIPISQFAPTNIDQAVARTILQTVSQLPPVTNVGLSYQYDPQLDTFVARKGSLGSGMVPAARFARKGSITGVLSFAYFGLDQFNGEDSSSVVVNVPSDRFNPNSPKYNLGVATRVTTDVYVARLASRYTILDNMDVGLTLPLIVTKVGSRYVVQQLQGQQEIDRFANRGVKSPDLGNTLIDAPLNEIGIPGGFNDGTNFNTGNMVLDTKYGIPLGTPDFGVGFQVELRLPTASESRFTGTDTTSLRGLFLANWQSEIVGAYLAAGYEQDFSTNVLSNGSVAASITAQITDYLLLEGGMNGAFYVKDIDLYDSSKFGVVLPGTTIVAGSSNLGKNEINAGGGLRLNPAGDLSLSLYATTPVNDSGYRPQEVIAASVDYPF